MNHTTPEKIGVSSENVKKYIDVLEQHHLSTHDVILARGNEIFLEKYWSPFHPDFLHRMYSTTKSIVALAVGFAEQDGLLSLDDKISKFFEKEIAETGQTDPNMLNQTVRHMLMMSTGKAAMSWLSYRTDDRVRMYFENKFDSRPSGTIYQYDSSGSFLLGALVERVTGMELMAYLRRKFMDKIGVSKEAYFLKCPGGHAWGDSALMCTPMDLLRIARFTLNKGKWDGEQLLNEEFVTTATSKLIDNNHVDAYNYKSHGYGYQIWRTYDNSFFFNGMGCQLAVCAPDKDMILIYNGDNMVDDDSAKEIIIGKFFEYIVRPAAGKGTFFEALPENKEAQAALEEPLKLMCAKGEAYTPFREQINGVTFDLQPNKMGMTEFSLHFAEDRCRFHYSNAQGEKDLWFGMTENVFDKFPQEGYADEVGAVATKGHYYGCAASAAWTEPRKLHIKVQIIDKYFGRLDMIFGFADADHVGIYMQKTAEDFLDEYTGFATGIRKA